MSNAARRYWVCLFASGSVLAVLVNAAQAKGVRAIPGTWTAVAVAAAPPAIFAALALGWHLTGRAASRRTRGLTGTAVGALAVASFAVSYATQRSFVAVQSGTLPEWTGWVVPGMLDTLVAVSGLVIFAHQVDSPVHVDKPRAPSRWKRLADAATTRAEAVLLVSPEPGRMVDTPQVGAVFSSAEPSVEASAMATQDLRESPAEGSADGDHALRGASATPSAEPSANGSEPLFETSVESSAESSAQPSTKPPRRAAKPSVNPSVKPFLTAAKEMETEGVVARKSAVEIAHVIAAVDTGLSDNAIKRKLGVSPGATEKIRAAWKIRQSQPRRLTTVG